MMHRSIVLALASVAVAAPHPAADSAPIAFPRRTTVHADGSLDERALLASVSRALVKYRHAPLPQPAVFHDKRAVGNVTLTDETHGAVDTIYYGTGSVRGTNFTLEFDTGHADLFVPGPACANCNGAARYANAGQDQGRTTVLPYGSGQVAGEDYKDAVAIAGFTVPAQGFISLTDGSGVAGSGAQGAVGLAFSTIAQSGYRTFTENLLAQGDLTAPQFAFYLGRSAAGTQAASELTIGGADKTRYCATPVAVPVTKKEYWQVALDGVRVNGKSAGATTAGQASIDTGTTIILAPSAAAAAIFAKIPGAAPLQPVQGSTTPITFYSYPCKTAAKYIPALQFAGKSFAIHPKDFNLGTLGSASSLNIFGGPQPVSGFGTSTTKCLAGIAAADIDPTNPLYVVGDVFLKNWYSIFDYTTPSVSFAPAVHNNPLA